VHLGLIGGIGPAATEFYYRQLVRAHASAGCALDLTIVHADVQELVRNLADDARHRQARIFERLVRRLQTAGAEAAAVTSIAGHFCARELSAVSPLPIVDALPAIDAELVRRGVKRVGLIGTRAVMGSRLYGGLSAAEVVIPEGDAFGATHDAYVGMATAGQATDEQRELVFAVGRELCARQGAEAVALAGTDLFLAFEGRECGFPTIDCATVHVGALLHVSMARAAPAGERAAIAPLRRPDTELGALVAESEQAGLRFVRRLVEEWASGANRFDGPGEALLGAWIDGQLVGVCGLNVDPFATGARVGRVRHLYVLSSARGGGVGRSLTAEVIRAARGPFDTLRLRTGNATAARLYEALGFRRVDGAADCTHVMELSPADRGAR
jgi:aspartate racemase